MTKRPLLTICVTKLVIIAFALIMTRIIAVPKRILITFSLQIILKLVYTLRNIMSNIGIIYIIFSRINKILKNKITSYF